MITILDIGNGYTVRRDHITTNVSTAKEVIALVTDMLKKDEALKNVPPLPEPCPQCGRNYCICDAVEKG